MSPTVAVLACASALIGAPRIMTSRLLAPRMGIGDGAAGTAAGGGGDIYGGGDSERNAQLAALLKMFTAKSDAPIPESEGSEQATKEVEEAKRLGLRLDMPLCRYSWCILPGQQIAMSVWQPQYTLMFSTLLGQPGPHEYFHVLLPGGAESLGRDGYELEPGSKSSLVGTLMRIAYAKRNEDSTLTLVVQGLARGVVLRPTQVLPYSRGDVQLLPDGEAMRSAARVSQRFLEAQAGWEQPQTCDPEDTVRPRPTPKSALDAAFRRRLCIATAVREVEGLFAYESTETPALDPPGRRGSGQIAQLTQFNASAAGAIAAAAAASVAVLAEMPMPQNAPIGGAAADEAGSALKEEVTALKEEEAFASRLTYRGRVLADLDAAVASAEAETRLNLRCAAEAEELRTIRELEAMTWIEFDDLLQSLRMLPPGGSPLPSRSTSLPIPTQLLALWPPPPEGGWPVTCRLAEIAAGLQQAIAMSYPARKRAERLSWMIWCTIGDQKVGVNAYTGSPFQALLEAEGTAERLRMVLEKLRAIKDEATGGTRDGSRDT